MVVNYLVQWKLTDGRLKFIVKIWKVVSYLKRSE